MRIATTIDYAADFNAAVDRVVAMEAAGLDLVFVAEAYSFDAISQIGYLAAKTSRVQLATGIINVYSRSPALIAMTAAGCDYVSNGRFNLGLGASGAQVVEGFHAVPYDKPLARIRDTIEICRKVWRREVLTHDGAAVQVPLPAGHGTGLGKPLKLINHPVRSSIPIWWASLMDVAVETTAELADGWLPIFFIPERADRVWGDRLRAGSAKRSADLGPLEIAAGGTVAIGDDLPVEKMRDASRPHVALYVGGMGARGKNFYNDLAIRYGFGDAARTIQDLYLDGHKAEAAAAVPAEWVEQMNLIGPRSYVAERVAAFAEAGVTTLTVNLIGPDPIRTLEILRDICDSV
jgi:F420-dependent oxidoreductase-like protein